MITFNKILERVYDEAMGISKEDIQRRFNRIKKIYIVFLMYIALFLKSKKVGAFIAKIIAKEYKRIKEELYVESMDYSQICREIKECCQYPQMLEKSYKFFFDETNNYRVFHIKGGDFNESPTKYFVLGGVCFEAQEWPDFSEVKNQLNLQPNMMEIKAKHIFHKKHFAERLKEKRLNIILKWLEKEKCFLHMEAVDHLEIIVENIVEKCICGKRGDGEKYVMSDAIYRTAKKDMKSFTKILVRYDFPCIDRKSWKPFCDELIHMLENERLNGKVGDVIEMFGKKIFYEVPIDILKDARDNIFECDMSNKIIESYKMYYLFKPLMFTNSSHVYDMEPEIWEKMKNETIYVEGEALKNYTFMDSKVNGMIQLSDVMVSLLASFLEYVNSFEIGKKTLESVQNMKEVIKEPLQRENFCLLMKILRRSEKENEFFMRMHGDFVNMNVFSFLIGVTKITDEGVSFIPEGKRKQS